MNELLKIPTNFHELSNVNVLFDTVEFLDQVKQQINDYTAAFVNSFLMTRSEVELYIPECDHNKYKVCPNTHSRCSSAHKNINLYATLHEKLKHLNDSENAKIFVVDTVKKEINLCWLHSNENNDLNQLLNFDMHRSPNVSDTYSLSGYEKDELITFNKEKKQIVITNYAQFSKSYRTGGNGIWISTYGGRGYYQGSSMNRDYFKMTIENRFCIHTNQYLGSSKMKIETLYK